MTDPLTFSIIIPTYNRAKLLQGAIKSVLAQTYPHWELIVIDDGSTDQTKEVVTEYLCDERVRYHWQENRELNGARNSGVQLAQGAYLAFLDDDDYYLPDYLQSASEVISVQQQNAVYRTRLTNDSHKSHQWHPLKRLWFYPDNLLPLFFPSQVFEKFHFSEEYLLAEDFHFLMSVFAAFPVIDVDVKGVVYQLQPSSRSVTYFQPEHLANKLAAIRATWQLHESKLNQHLPQWALNWKTGTTYLHFSRLAFRAKESQLGWLYWRQSLPFFTFQSYFAYVRTFALGLIGR